MSNESFSVGEIAIIAYSLHFPDRTGEEVCVSHGLGLHAYTHHVTRQPGEAVGYYARCSNGERRFFHKDQLRKKRPPQNWIALCNLTDVPSEVTA